VVPEQIGFLKALLGDPSDKVPRAVPRMKTATIKRLVQEAERFNRVPHAVANADWMTQKEKDKLLAAKERAILNYKLVKLQDSLLLKSQQGTPDIEKAKEVLDRQGAVMDDAGLSLIIGL
jgi:5'-3' exonuclease